MEVARLAVEVSSEKQASDVVLLDLRGITSFADYFVICSADSTRQISSIANDLERSLRDQGLRAHHREGKGGTNMSGVSIDPEPDLVRTWRGTWSAKPAIS